MKVRVKGVEKMPTEYEMGLKFPQNYSEFESIVCEYFSYVYNTPFQKYGRQGQCQSGIDLIAENIGVQCKNYGIAKLQVNNLESDISAAEQIQPKLNHLYIVTTAPKDVNIQNYIRNRKSEFTVEIYYWDVIQAFLLTNPEIKDMFYPKENFLDDTDLFIHKFLELCVKYYLYDTLCNNDFISPYRKEAFFNIDNLKEELTALLHSEIAIKVNKKVLNDINILIGNFEYITSIASISSTPNNNGVCIPHFPIENKVEIEKNLVENRDEAYGIYYKYKF